MKAAVFHGKGDIRIDKAYPNPNIKADEVLVRVKACGVCGTDLHIFSGAQGATECKPPVILGHEFSGIVEEIGSNITRVRVGQHVTVDPNIACGACGPCRRGTPHFCNRLAATGVNYDGGFAEYCAVLEKQVYAVPDDIPFEELALCEPVGCCLHGIDLSDIQTGDTVMIAGGGTIGLIMLQLAMLRGAVRTVVLEANESRFALIRQLGADLVLNPLHTDVGAELQKHGLTDIRVVIECAGRPETIGYAIEHVGNAGTVMIFGLTEPDCTIPFKPFEAFRKELTIKTSFINPNTQGRAAEIIASKKLRLAELISDRVTLDDIADTFHPGPRKGKTIILT